MTAQTPDLVLLDGEEHVIAGVLGGGLFDPHQHDIWPVAIHTGCWRGFVARYTVRDDRLRLEHLTLGLESSVGGMPPISGATITAQTELLGRRPVNSDHTWVLADLDVPVDFSGGLLLGRDFLREHYVHMGFHPAWKYARVTELVADDGVVTTLADRSAEVAAIRERIAAGEQPDPDTRAETSAWIRRTFTLDYSRTFGLT